MGSSGCDGTSDGPSGRAGGTRDRGRDPTVKPQEGGLDEGPAAPRYVPVRPRRPAMGMLRNGAISTLSMRVPSMSTTSKR